MTTLSSADKYYATALHELGHWTGYESRLNRDLAHPFGSEGYAKEELRAEISSMLLGDTLGIGHDPGQHAAYVGSWIKSLRDDPLEIFRAAANAEKIQAFVLGLEQKQVQTQEETANQAHDQQQNEIEANLTQGTESIFTILPKDLSLLSSATAADYEEAVNKARIEDKTYLQVPYQERNQAKALGAKWDRGIQSWYVPADVDISLFSQWPQTDNVAKTERQYLAVPYTDRNSAKEAGAIWDKTAKSWYVGQHAIIDTLKQWLPENVTDQQTPALTPQQEFTDALASLGCLITGEHPIMDGQTHRIATEGDKPGERAGFYVAYLDGHPAGYIQNNRTGDSLKWKAKGYTLSETEKAQLQAQNATKLQEREAALKAKQDAVAHTVRRLLEIAPPAPGDHPYLQQKQARPGNLRAIPGLRNTGGFSASTGSTRYRRSWTGGAATLNWSASGR